MWLAERPHDLKLTVPCSVFAGGFNLESACAVTGSDDVDDYAVLDRLDALVRKSLLVGDRSSGRTRFSMLETIRQLAEEQLVTRGVAEDTRAVHAHHFAGREATSSPCGTAPANTRPTTGSPPNWPTCAPPFGGPPTTATSMMPPPSPPTRRTSASGSKLTSRSRGPKSSSSPPTPSTTPASRSCCDRVSVLLGRTHRGGYRLQRRRPEGNRQWPRQVPYGLEGMPGGVHLVTGQPERWVEKCRAACGRDTHTFTRAFLVMALTIVGSRDEAMTAANSLIEAAEAAGNPCALSYALLAYGLACDDTDPVRALDALHRA